MARPTDPERLIAQERGDTRYPSTRPCPRNHVGERYVANTSCCTCAELRGLKWRKKTPKVKVEVKKVKPIEARLSTAKINRIIGKYHSSSTAHARSRHLDRLTKNMTAAIIKVSPT